MKPAKIFTVLFLMLIISTTTFAQPGRTIIQQRRIEQGIRSGELTRHETRQLERQQRFIWHERREAHFDRIVTPRERREIRRERRHASRNIFRKRHNRRNWI